MLMRIWREVGCPCSTYFQANIGEWLRDLCEDYSNYRNFCVPCKILVAKVKRVSQRHDRPSKTFMRVSSF